ncbi:hypothetical protein NDU88_003441 [Pleurodeles waltl]|uniref:Uncharacterized protein n=1 Tax=Pleurodeles waltl TaxID=8319 RepID=A0AAV7TQM5_PLEWA|nr:hypothetical protein NDU88_003441 [Pleurodeles waltl]
MVEGRERFAGARGQAEGCSRGIECRSAGAGLGPACCGWGWQQRWVKLIFLCPVPEHRAWCVGTPACSMKYRGPAEQRGIDGSRTKLGAACVLQRRSRCSNARAPEVSVMGWPWPWGLKTEKGPKLRQAGPQDLEFGALQGAPLKMTVFEAGVPVLRGIIDSSEGRLGPEGGLGPGSPIDPVKSGRVPVVGLEGCNYVTGGNWWLPGIIGLAGVASHLL